MLLTWSYLDKNLKVHNQDIKDRLAAKSLAIKVPKPPNDLMVFNKVMKEISVEQNYSYVKTTGQDVVIYSYFGCDNVFNVTDSSIRSDSLYLQQLITERFMETKGTLDHFAIRYFLSKSFEQYFGAVKFEQTNNFLIATKESEAKDFVSLMNDLLEPHQSYLRSTKVRSSFDLAKEVQSYYDNTLDEIAKRVAELSDKETVLMKDISSVEKKIRKIKSDSANFKPKPIIASRMNEIQRSLTKLKEENEK